MTQEYVGIDLHRRRSVIYRMDQAGEKIDSVRVDNEPSRFAKEVSAAPAGSDVIVEATYGWYWAVDLLAEMGYRVHLANPHGNDWGHRRVKNDERDARDLADLLRLGRLAEAWIAPPQIRELREMVRFRLKLSNLRTGLKAQVHAVMAKNGILPCRNDMWGPGGSAQLDSLELPAAYFNRIAVLRDLVEAYDREILFLDRDIHLMLSDDAAYYAIQAIYGVGRVLAAVFVAENVHMLLSPVAKPPKRTTFPILGSYAIAALSPADGLVAENNWVQADRSNVQVWSSSVSLPARPMVVGPTPPKRTVFPMLGSNTIESPNEAAGPVPGKS